MHKVDKCKVYYDCTEEESACTPKKCKFKYTSGPLCMMFDCVPPPPSPPHPVRTGLLSVGGIVLAGLIVAASYWGYKYYNGWRGSDERVCT